MNKVKTYSACACELYLFTIRNLSNTSFGWLGVTFAFNIKEVGVVFGAKASHLASEKD